MYSRNYKLLTPSFSPKLLSINSDVSQTNELVIVLNAVRTLITSIPSCRTSYWSASTKCEEQTMDINHIAKLCILQTHSVEQPVICSALCSHDFPYGVHSILSPKSDDLFSFLVNILSYMS